MRFETNKDNIYLINLSLHHTTRIGINGLNLLTGFVGNYEINNRFWLSWLNLSSSNSNFFNLLI